MATQPKELPRDALKRLWKRTGLSGIEVAKRAGYAAPSGFYALMQDRQGSRPIAHEAIKRLIPVFRGLGEPPVTVDELLAISDAASPGPVATQSLSTAVTAAADTVAFGKETIGGVLLPIRYRCERGTYVDTKAPARNYGSSRIAVSTEYPMMAQCAAIVSDQHAAAMFKQSTHLHVVQRSAFNTAEMGGRTVILGTSTRGDLVEVIVARVQRVDDGGELRFVSAAGDDVTGTVLGVVVGAYVTL